MAYLLGVDTGGTYTDAVILDEAADNVVAKSKALTTRPDLSGGVGAAIDAVLAQADVAAARIGMVSLSTTLATNALVEGQGGRAALVLIGFAAKELERAGLAEALGGDPVVFVAGGHDHAGGEAQAFDGTALEEALAALPGGLTGIAIAGRFATRNNAHERLAASRVAAVTGLPVTLSHEMSAGLGGPKRALTALLNARLVGLIARLIDACQAYLDQRGIAAPLMVVRGDGALMPAALARARPIETILSGPAASIAGASWLTGETDAFVSDIGGTTTDVCLLCGGRPAIDPDGASVGGFRTMVEAVAMRTTGLGGDSEVHLVEGLRGGVTLGPRRVMPVSLAATLHPALVHEALDKALADAAAPAEAGQFVLPLWQTAPAGLDRREQAVVDRLAEGPLRLGQAVRAQTERPALSRLIARGLVMLAAVTPSDAAHVLGLADAWDVEAAEKALTLFARRRIGGGDRLAEDAEGMARMIVDRLTVQTTDALLRAAFVSDGRDWGAAPGTLAAHPLTLAGLDGYRGLVETDLRLGVPVIGLGASAASYYGAVGSQLGTRMIVPDHADVANAIGAVVGQVSVAAKGSATAPGAGRVVIHSADGPESFDHPDAALKALEERLNAQARAQADEAGIVAPRIEVMPDIRYATIEGRRSFVGADITVTARGRPRIAAG